MRSIIALSVLTAAMLPVLQASAQPHTECAATVQVFPGTTLARLADVHFGDVDYRYAILLATNGRAGQGFQFISNPNDLSKIDRLCIPNFAEAEVEKNRFLTYVEAVQDMALPYPSEVSTNLDPIDASKPATVVSWVRTDQADGWRDLVNKTQAIGNQSWVTLDPHLQDFCQTHIEQRGPDLRALTLRLEQRLGLAPRSAKTHFVTFEVANPGDTRQIFRPCVDTAVDTTTCAFKALPNCNKLTVPVAGGTTPRPATAEEKTACETNYAFITSQYYTSYGVTLPTEFPWTSLGYTFDWAHKAIGLTDRPEFEQFGESEYVLPATAMVTVKSVIPTAEYCAPVPK